MLLRILNFLLSFTTTRQFARSPSGLVLVKSCSGLVNPKDALTRRIYAICNSADEQGIEALPATQRAVVLAWAGRGIIGNGGFKYFYEGQWRMAETAAAYRILGFPEAADACERSLDVFPKRQPPRDDEEREQFLGEESSNLFEELEKVVYALDWDSLKLAIGSYIESRPEAFREFR